jgi:hypothetical protein
MYVTQQGTILRIQQTFPAVPNYYESLTLHNLHEQAPKSV